MLYIFCGDRYAAREQCRAFADGCKKKRVDAEYIYFSPDAMEQSLEVLLSRQGLFENKYIVFCNEVLSDSKCNKCILENTDAYIKSQHMFIMFEPGLSVKDEKYFDKKGGTVKRFQEKPKQEDSKMLFSFLDVFLRQNKQKTLAEFHKILLKNESAEAVLNILLWQLRMLTLVSKTKSATEAGIKPFVYTKSKKALETIPSPFDLLVFAEHTLRNGRLRSLTNEEIVEYIIVSA